MRNKKIMIRFSNIVACVFLFAVMSFPALTIGQDIKVYDQDYDLKYRVEGDRIYDKDWNLRYRIEDDKIYDRNWNLKYHREGNRIYDKSYNLRYRLDNKGIK